jgi:hypothetical protein
VPTWGMDTSSGCVPWWKRNGGGEESCMVGS